MEIIKVIIADDHVIFRKGLRTVLNEISSVKVIAETSNGAEILKFLKTEDADIIFMDINMPVMSGIEATQAVLEKYPHIGIIALTMHEEIGYFNKMIEAGARGFLLKKTNKEQLEAALKAVWAGETYFSEEFIISVPKNPQPKSDFDISEREKDVLFLLAKGMSNSEIAEKLFLSKRTVDGHKSRLFEKTGVKNSAMLIMFAIKHGIIH